MRREALLPQDPALPHLAQAVDANAMARAFGEVLRTQGREVVSCDVERVKYRPRRNCSVSYRLQLADERTGLRMEQRVAARLCTAADAAQRARHAPPWPLTASRAGPSFQLLDGLDMVTWWWPNDARLLAPRVLCDTRRMTEEVMPAVAQALSGGRAQCLSHTVEVLQYVPEQRVTAAVDLVLKDGAGTRACRVYAKASLEPGVAQAHALLKQVQASAAWTRGALRTPRALLLQAAHGLHWLGAVPGVPLLDLPTPKAQACLPALAGQLAALHGCAAPASPLNLDDEADRLRRVAQVLGQSSPALEALSTVGAAQLEAGLARAFAQPRVCLHGDLHPRNVLVEGQDLALIDLDGLRGGPALLDLGSWIGDGLFRALLEGRPVLGELAAWRDFIDAYERASGTRVEAADLAWSVAWALYTQRAWRCVVTLKPGRWALVPELLEWAVRLSGPQGREGWA